VRWPAVAPSCDGVRLDIVRRRQYDSRGDGGFNWGANWGFNWQNNQQERRQRSADFFHSDPLVVRLGAKTWPTKVLTSDLPWVVIFYTSTCPYCAHQSREWSRVAELLADDDRYDLEIGAVNCGSQQALCNSLGVRVDYHPWIRVYIPVEDVSPPPYVSGGGFRMLHWAALESNQGAERQVDWLRSVLDEGGDSRQSVYLLNATTFTATVFGSTSLWVVAYVAFGDVAWSPISPFLESQIRKLSCLDFCEHSEHATTVRFGIVNCESDGQLCAAAGIGKPYGFGEGDMPQLVAYPAGRHKAGSYKLMPSHLYRVHRYEVVDRVGHLGPTLQAALGCAPDWAAASGMEGVAGAAFQPATWKKEREQASGRDYWSSGFGSAQWDKPAGW